MPGYGKATKKYNIVLSKLFETIVTLNEEQQVALLKYAEELSLSDKRCNHRIPCAIPVTFAARSRVFSDYIKNISSNGVYIETREKLGVGEDVFMNFTLNGFDRTLRVEGKIARTDPKGMGIKFVNVSPYQTEMIGVVVDRMHHSPQ